MKLMYRQFIKFAIVGTSNTAIDFLIYAALTRLWEYWFDHKILASTIAFIIATVNSYSWNKYWTFRNKNQDHRVLFAKFFVVSSIGLGINVGIFSMLLPSGMNDIMIKILAIVVVLFWNFLANKFWTFAEKN